VLRVAAKGKPTNMYHEAEPCWLAGRNVAILMHSRTRVTMSRNHTARSARREHIVYILSPESGITPLSRHMELGDIVHRKNARSGS
jgi:hypothetical protein